MVFTGAEIVALKGGLRKAASALGHAALTGPGPGAGSVDKPLRTSRIPGRERRKQTIEPADAERFARKIIERVGGQRFTLPGRTRPRRLEIPAADVDALATAVGVLVSALPRGRLDMAAVVDAHGEAEVLADSMRVGLPATADNVRDALAPVLDELVIVVCEHVIEFFTARQTFPAAAELELLKQSARKYQPEEEKELLAAYARLVHRKFHRIRLFGLDLHEDEQAYDLMTGFVELSIETVGKGVTDHRGMLVEHFSWNRMDALVTAHQRVLLEGPAGSGKSTLLQWLTLNSLKATDLKPVPFLIRLREFVRGQELRLPKPVEFFEAVAEPLAGQVPGLAVELLTTGRASVLVDGIDEVPEQLRGRALQWLADLADTCPKAQFVVTTRPAGIDKAWRRRLTEEYGFAKAAVNPMSTDQVSAFIDSWHAADHRGADPEELRESAASLKQAIRRRRDLSHITTTPLLCAMVCALYRADNRALPRNRTALYERACTMLLEKRDTQQKIQTFPVTLTREQVEPFLTEIALWMLVNKQRSIPQTDALELVAEVLPRLQVPDAPDRWKPNAPELLRHLVVRSGVLQEPTMELLEFVHPSFQDFLAAKGVFRKKYLPHLIANAHDPMYQDVVVMAVGHVQNDRDRQDELLEGLLERAKTDRANARQLYLLMAASIADAGMVDPKWVKAVRTKTRALLPPRSSREAQVLVSAGEFTLDLLADIGPGHKYTVDEAQATIEAIRLMGGGGDVGTRILRTIAETFGRRIAFSLISAWHSAQEPRTFRDEVLAHGDFSRYWVTITSADLLPLVDGLPGLSLLHASIPAIRPLPQIEGLKSLAIERRPVETLPDYPFLEHLEINGPSADDLQGVHRFEHLTSLELSECPAPELHHLVGLNKLTSLSLIQAPDADLSPLSQVETLHSLTIDGPSRVDLTPVADLRHLNRLSLGATPFATDKPLRHLRSLSVHTVPTDIHMCFPNLASVTVDAAGLDTATAAMDGMSSLTTVQIIETRAQIDVSRLTSIPHLATISLVGRGKSNPVGLPGLGITDLRLSSLPSRGYDDVAQLPNLRRLTMQGVPGRALSKLPPLAALKELALWNVDNPALAKLGDVADLTSLELGNLSADLTQLAAFGGLKALEISETHAVDIEPLAMLTDLEELSIYHVKHFDGSVLRRMTGLKRLLLVGDRQIEPAWLPPEAELALFGLGNLTPEDLNAIPTLREVRLPEMPEGGLAPLAAVPAIERLALFGVLGVDVRDLATWPALTSLTLRHVPGLDYDALTALPHLRELHVQRMPYRGIEALRRLEVLEVFDNEVPLSDLAGLPNLRHLILNTTPESDLSLLASLPRLKKLELASMPWADLSPFQARPDIEIIQR